MWWRWVCACTGGLVGVESLIVDVRVLVIDVCIGVVNV